MGRSLARRLVALLLAVLALGGAAGCSEKDRSVSKPPAKHDAANGTNGQGAPGSSDGAGSTSTGTGRSDASAGGGAPTGPGLPGGSGAPAPGRSSETTARAGRAAGPERPRGWRTIAGSPLSGRHSHSAVWTGREMIVWGGAWRAGNAAIYLDDGAAYDPATNRWRRLPPSPLASRADHVAAWTGREMLVWGGNPGTETAYGANEFVDGAAYDPARNRWRPMADFPLGPRYGARAVWTGKLLVVWGGARAEDGEDPPRRSDGAAYDPATNRWTVLPPSPLPGRVGALAAPTARGVLFSWGIAQGRKAAPESAFYDPSTRRWSAATPAPPTDTGWCLDLSGCVGVDAGDRVLFAGEGLTYAPATGQWAGLPPNPFADPLRDGKAVVWTGQRALLWGGGTYEGESDSYPSKVTGEPGAAYDPLSRRWEPLLPGPLAPRARGRAVWTGEEMLAWGGESAQDKRVQYADGAAYRP